MNPDRRLEIGRGDGTAIAVPGIALLVAGGSAPDGLLEIVRAAAASQPPGRELARRLAGLLTGDDAGAVPPFGAVAEVENGLLVFLSGPVTATTVGGDGSAVRLSGSEATTWVDRVLGPDAGSVFIAPDGVAVEQPTPFELAAGVVPAGWLRVTAADQEASPPRATPAAEPDPVPEPAVIASPVAPPPIPPPPAAPAADAPAVPEVPAAPPAPEEPPTEALPTSFESFSLQPDRDSIRAPLPTEAADAPAPEVTDEPIPERKMVQGIMCSRHHFNSPDSAYCSSCGISMVHATHNLVTRERPPLGFLVFDDGSTFTLDDRYVLGREPETDALVQADEARPIPLEDPQMSVSRVHAEIQLVGWDVQLMDRGSTNGTHILNERGDGWDRLVPDQPRIVAPGSRIAVGQRTFVYETPQRG